MSRLFRQVPGRSSRAPAVGGAPRSLVLLAGVVALLAAACSTSPATAEVADDCFLGLDLWDTDPSLTWIEDGKVWVRAGGHQACLAYTDAADLEWSPDGRRLLLDDGLFEAGAAHSYATVPQARQIVWHEPLGTTLHVVDDGGSVVRIAGDHEIQAPDEVALVATHPDGAHVATVSATGVVTLSAADGTVGADLLQLDSSDLAVQMEFAADGSRLWVLSSSGSDSKVGYVDLLPISAKLEVEPVESIVPGMSVPVPELYFVDADLTAPLPTLGTGIGAIGADITRFVLHPAHRDWVGVTEGSCGAATSSLFLEGEVSAAALPGAVVGFFRGGGEPILATTSAGGECGTGQLWVVDGLPSTATATLIAEDVTSADIRDEAPDPWNPNTAPPFA